MNKTQIILDYLKRKKNLEERGLVSGGPFNNFNMLNYYVDRITDINIRVSILSQIFGQYADQHIVKLFHDRREYIRRANDILEKMTKLSKSDEDKLINVDFKNYLKGIANVGENEIDRDTLDINFVHLMNNYSTHYDNSNMLLKSFVGLMPDEKTYYSRCEQALKGSKLDDKQKKNYLDFIKYLYEFHSIEEDFDMYAYLQDIIDTSERQLYLSKDGTNRIIEDRNIVFRQTYAISLEMLDDIFNINEKFADVYNKVVENVEKDGDRTISGNDLEENKLNVYGSKYKEMPEIVLTDDIRLAIENIDNMPFHFKANEEALISRKAMTSMFEVLFARCVIRNNMKKFDKLVNVAQNGNGLPQELFHNANIIRYLLKNYGKDELYFVDEDGNRLEYDEAREDFVLNYANVELIKADKDVYGEIPEGMEIVE